MMHTTLHPSPPSLQRLKKPSPKKEPQLIQATSPTITVPVENQSTAQSSKTKISSSPTPALVSSPWPTQVPAPTARSSSSVPPKPPGLMASMLSLELLPRVSISSRRLRLLEPRVERLARRLSLQSLVSFKRS
jgi:hypothetical protein